jgi:hypothetical protein
MAGSEAGTVEAPPAADSQAENPQAPQPHLPTREEIRAAIKNPETPALVRRFLRQQLYGEGGGGRKAVQQERLQREGIRTAQKSNPADKIVDRLFGKPEKQELRRPEGMSGRQFKRARKLIRQGRKFVQGATQQ